MSGVDPALVSLVRAELRCRGRMPTVPERRPSWARALARSIHRGEHEMLEHLRRVAEAVPDLCVPVAWLHHASDGRPHVTEFLAAGLSPSQSDAFRMLSRTTEADARTPDMGRRSAVARASGSASEIARAIAHAARLDLARVGDLICCEAAALNESRTARVAT
jgi:hypothetical protein